MRQSRSLGLLRCVVADANLRIGIEKRFWTHVKKTNGCWFWTGHIGRGGYGMYPIKRFNIVASRVAWTLSTGSVPKYDICHHCDTPRCVRPDHLFEGAEQENCDDMVRKGRQARWERGANSKLTVEQVKQIRKEYRKGVPGFSTVALGKKYGIASNNIWQIVKGNAWKGI